jgi:hypothetical protein
MTTTLWALGGVGAASVVLSMWLTRTGHRAASYWFLCGAWASLGAYWALVISDTARGPS